MHVKAGKHARLEGSGGVLPQEILESRCSEIASEANLGQKQSRSHNKSSASCLWHGQL